MYFLALALKQLILNVENYMDMDKKTMAIIGGVVLLIIIAAVLINQNKKDSATTPRQSTQTQTEEFNTPDESGVSTTTPSSTPATTGSAANLSYNQALKIYGANGYRIQFSECHGLPGYLSIRQGVKFMLDNRDNKAHTIKVKSRSFKLPAYGFAVITATETGTYNITCDGGGAAELNVEAK